MYLQKYYQPNSIEEAYTILDKHLEDNIEVIAGGTEINLKHLNNDYLVDINNLGLNYVKEDNKWIRIGATTTIWEIETSDIIKRKPYEALYQAAYKWTQNVKHQSTIGGNICEAIPSSDMTAPIIALDGLGIIEGPQGEREMSVQNIAENFRQTALNDNEILKEIKIPKKSSNTYSKYKRIVRTEHDITLTGVAIKLTIKNSKIQSPNIGVLGASKIPIQPQKTIETLENKEINKETVKRALKTIGDECAPRSSLRASEEYRKHLEKTLLKKGLNEIQEEVE